jgi:MarR-like DNA-binding transcriptional regulator SgrR of sgrS sRNA
MKKLPKTGLGLLALLLIFAIKTYYGGEISIRLNEPASFTFSSSTYSNLIFYALIHENFFYLRENGEIFSNIFSIYEYDKSKKTLVMQLRENLSFSNGDAITARNVKISLNLFLNQNLASAKKIRRIIKHINSVGNTIYIELLYDTPEIVSFLTVPELVLLSAGKQSFSGLFYPHEWEKNEYLVLKPNTYYAGGRSFLDSFKVYFYDEKNPDIFLSNPGEFKEYGYREYDSGIYQNVYISFPKGQIGKNTRTALYSFLKQFYISLGNSELNSLTSDQESPVSISIKRFSNRRMRTILRYSNISLYILSSLSGIENSLNEFLGKKGVSLKTIYISENQLVEYLNNTTIQYLLLGKVFGKRMPLDEKIKKILQEMSFSRFNEKYLKMLNELDEVKYLKNEELLIDQIARIIEKIISDGFMLPISQKRYSLYIKNKIKGVEMDYYGRPLFHKAGIR